MWSSNVGTSRESEVGRGAQACTWASQAASSGGWFKFHSPKSAGAAPAVETLPGDVPTGSQTISTLTVNVYITISLRSRCILAAHSQSHVPFTTLSWHYRQCGSYFPLLSHTHTPSSLCSWPHPCTSQSDIIVFIHDYCAAIKAAEMALSSHVLTFRPTDPYECERMSPSSHI